MIFNMKVKNLSKRYCLKSGKSRTAFEKASFEILPGEAFGLFGPSGCGKSTLARCLLLLEQPTEGEIEVCGCSLLSFSKSQMIEFRCSAQMIFQNAGASLNPRMTVGALLSEPFRIHFEVDHEDEMKHCAKLLELVGLSRSSINRYPHEFSGGQLQRIAIARALALRPKLLVCDEPLSSLDISVQAQIVNLLKDLQKELHLTYLFISHDPAIVKYFCDRIALMQDGRIEEVVPSDEFFYSF